MKGVVKYRFEVNTPAGDGTLAAIAFNPGVEVEILGKFPYKIMQSKVAYVISLEGNSFVVDSFLIDDGIKVIHYGDSGLDNIVQ